MLYKTIVLELIEQRPPLHERLKAARALLATVNRCAMLLKENHEALIEQLRASRPQSDSSQLSSEAMEIAVKEIEQVLSQATMDEEFSLEDAMTFLRRHTPRE